MLTFVAPFIAYLIAFPVMVISLFRIEVGILYFITLVPILAVMKKFVHFPLGSNVMDFLLICMVLGWIFGALREGRRVFKRSPLNVAVIIVVIWTFVNLLRGYGFFEFSNAVHLMRLMAWKNYMILPVVYLIAINNINDKRVIQWIIVALCVTMLAMDFNFYSTFRWFRAEHFREGIRISGTFTFLGPNEMGVFYSMYTFLLIGIAYCLENKKLKALMLLVCACNFYPILFSYSRAAYLCTLAGIISLGLLKDRRLLVLLVALVLAYRIILPTSVVERIDMTFLDKAAVSEEEMQRTEVTVGGVALDSTGRKALWDRAKGYFRKYPFMGIGFDTFRHLEGMITHSLYMRILAEQGLIGMAVFILFSLCLLQQSFRLYRRAPEGLERGVGLGFLVCVIVHLVGSITGDQSLYYNLMAIYWLFLGIVGNLNVELAEQDALRGREGIPVSEMWEKGMWPREEPAATTACEGDESGRPDALRMTDPWRAP